MFEIEYQYDQKIQRLTFIITTNAGSKTYIAQDVLPDVKDKFDWLLGKNKGQAIAYIRRRSTVLDSTATQDTLDADAAEHEQFEKYKTDPQYQKNYDKLLQDIKSLSPKSSLSVTDVVKAFKIDDPPASDIKTTALPSLYLAVEDEEEREQEEDIWDKSNLTRQDRTERTTQPAYRMNEPSGETI